MSALEHAAPFIGPLTQEDSKALRIYYVIYSYSLTRDGERLVNQMDPNSIGRNANSTPGYDYGPSLDGRWHQTEGDEQYDYDYLADELEGSGRPCQTCNGEACTEEEFTAPEGFVGVGIVGTFGNAWLLSEDRSHVSRDHIFVRELRPCEGCGGSGDLASAFRNGYHRKWVAELTHAEYLRLANDRGWDLDDDDRPTRFNDTMGSLTEYGHLPAIAIEDDEGWTYGGEIISAQFYVTMGELPMGATMPINESEDDR